MDTSYRKRLFEASLGYFELSYKSFAESIKRDRTTVHRTINNMMVKDNKYVNYKINSLINKMIREIKEIQL